VATFNIVPVFGAQLAQYNFPQPGQAPPPCCKKPPTGFPQFAHIPRAIMLPPASKDKMKVTVSHK